MSLIAADALAQTPEAEQAPTDVPAATALPAEPQYPVFVPEARLIMGLEKRVVHPEAEQQAEGNRQPFFFDQARIELDFQLNAWFEGSFSAELTADPVVRDAYVNVRIEREFQVQAGQFKRPISRIETTSTTKLPFRDRGLFNRALLRDAEWGNRALGVMLWGKLKHPDLHWYAAVMNAGPTADVPDLEQLRGVDLLGRVEYEPVQWLAIAVNGGRKSTQAYIGGPQLEMFAIGGDVRVRAAGLRLVLESIAAQNPLPPAPPVTPLRTPFAIGAMGYATYDIRLGLLTLQPVIAAEWLDTDVEYSSDETLRGLAGLNLLFWDDAFRLLPQVEVVRPLGSVTARSQLRRETYYLMLSGRI